ncbi:hypothetical protein PoB_000982700 [Plakobranchus ocellatus]|uniref:Uncharacterized protein n=1 Tax=Plakobranchus ocellatus TaxID=259542 RepID=A0AAV3YLR1_9GAST|nr:hypothetical protein PoB_000982700 [Plakobranchus ocellatus]
MLMVDSVNPLLRKKPEVKNAVTNKHKITHVEELVDKTLCDSVTRDCVERKCTKCGVEKLMSGIRVEVGDQLYEVREWKRWEKSERSPKDLVLKSGTVADLLGFLTEDLQLLSKHVKFAQWQRNQCNNFRDSLPIGHAMCTADFAENYLCKFQHEVQSAHWSYHQVTLHPCVFFYRCPVSGCRKNLNDYLVFISNDLKHDSSICKLIFDKCMSHAESKGIVSLQIFSDGCGSQYKSRLPFYHLTELQGSHTSLKIGRHFFGSGHGKSLCDSCGGTVKNCASRAVASGKHVIQSAKDLLNFCKSELEISPFSCFPFLCTES